MPVGIPLKEIVKSYNIEEGRDSMHKYMQYLHLAIDGLRELFWDINGTTKMEVLSPDAQGIIYLPEDFVKEVRLSAIALDGTLIPLGKNDNLFKAKDACGDYGGNQGNDLISNPDTGGVLWNTGNDHFNKGQFIGRYYGIGGRSTAGEYKINTGDSTIWLGMNVQSTHLVLEYIGYMPERVGGQFLVHPFLKEPLMNWIAYTSKRRLPSTPPALTEYLFKRYVDSKQWARQRFHNMDFTEVLEIARKNVTQSPKF